MILLDLRENFHQRICKRIIRLTRAKTGVKSYPNFADAQNANSIKVAWTLVNLLGCNLSDSSLLVEDAEDAAAAESERNENVGTAFENACKEFIEDAFKLLHHLRPGEWRVARNVYISEFDQYTHLADFAEMVKLAKREGSQAGRLLEQLLGRDYIIKPDIVVARVPVSDDEVNERGIVLLQDNTLAHFTPLRNANRDRAPLILHASISCKWTVRSDRSQNTRTEALNLIRNRKGNLPHVVAITAEPLPTRIASLAQGTGDMDCVYHFALPELREAVAQAHAEDQMEMLDELIQGRRLRDIADLPFDLAI